MRTCNIFICLLFACPAIAQKHQLSINYKPSFTYFGKQQQNFRHNYFNAREGNSTFNNAVNILYSYKLTPKLSITTGVEYAKQGQNINFKADSVQPGNGRRIMKIELNYIRIPLVINYSFKKTQQYEFKIYAGVSMGIALKRNDNYQDIILEDILLPAAEKRYQKNDWAVPMGFTFQKTITSKLFLNVGMEYTVGITNSFTDYTGAKFGVLSEFDNSRQKRLALNIGIGYNLAK